MPALGGAYSWGECLLWGWLFWGGLLHGVGSGGVPGGAPSGTATAAGGTHHTGMHSSCHYVFVALLTCLFSFYYDLRFTISGYQLQAGFPKKNIAGGNGLFPKLTMLALSVQHKSLNSN